MELATGIALWASPPQIKIPGMLALAALRGIRAKLRERDEESSPGGNNSDGSHPPSKDEVVVRWDLIGHHALSAEGTLTGESTFNAAWTIDAGQMQLELVYEEESSLEYEISMEVEATGGEAD